MFTTHPLKMKKTSFLHTHQLLPFKLVLILSVLLFGCKIKDETPPSFGLLSVYNLSPTFATYDVMVNDRKLNTADLPYGGGVKYTQFNTGAYQVKFNTAGTNNNIFTKNGLSITQSSFQTLYLAGTAGNFDGLLVDDNFPNSALDKAYVRFINLSPDAPALDLGVKDVATALTTNKAYKTNSSFMAIDEGAKVFQIKETSSGTVKITLESINLSKGSFYTIVAGGKVIPNGTLERSFNGQIILHL